MGDYKSRKFIAFILAFLASGVFLGYGKIDGSQYVTLISLVYGCYVGGNVWESKA